MDPFAARPSQSLPDRLPLKEPKTLDSFAFDHVQGRQLQGQETRDYCNRDRPSKSRCQTQALIMFFGALADLKRWKLVKITRRQHVL